MLELLRKIVEYSFAAVNLLQVRLPTLRMAVQNLL